MARIIPGPPVGQIRRFIPRSFNNFDDDDPVTIYIERITEDARRAIIENRLDVSDILDASSNSDPDIKTVTKATNTFKSDVVMAYVHSVENYERPISDDEFELIQTADQLLEFGEFEFVHEVFMHCMEFFSLGDEGKAEPVASTDSEQTRRIGTVEVASVTGSTNSEDALGPHQNHSSMSPS